MSSKPTHNVKLRNGSAPAEPVTDKQLAEMKTVFGRRMSEYDVTPIADEVPKPELANTAKSKASDKAAGQGSEIPA